MSQLTVSFSCRIRIGDTLVPLRTVFSGGASEAQSGVRNGFLFTLDRQPSDLPVRVNLGDIVGMIENKLGAGAGQLANAPGAEIAKQALPSGHDGFDGKNQTVLEVQSFLFNTSTDETRFAIGLDVVGSDPTKGAFALPPALAGWLRIDRVGLYFSARKVGT
jgi:hypothetical protein